MLNQTSLSPLLFSKLVLWIIVITAATILLNRKKVTPGIRIAFLIGGVLIFGFAYGFFAGQSINPNPVFSLRTFLMSGLVRGRIILPITVMLAVLLLTVWVSNKSICGWGCQLGLLQDLLSRFRLPKWKPPFWLSNTIRIIAFAGLVIGLMAAGLDWIGLIDPFRIFQFSVTLWVGLFFAAILISSLFIYRPWCQFLCPFGLVGWLLEQVSLFRPRVDREVCKDCQLCVEACPTQAMADIHFGKKIHADCFACGACFSACPKDKALRWCLPGRQVSS